MEEKSNDGRQSLFSCLIGSIIGLVVALVVFGGLLYLFFLA